MSERFGSRSTEFASQRTREEDETGFQKNLQDTFRVQFHAFRRAYASVRRDQSLAKLAANKAKLDATTKRHHQVLAERPGLRHNAAAAAHVSTSGSHAGDTSGINAGASKRPGCSTSQGAASGDGAKSHNKTNELDDEDDVSSPPPGKGSKNGEKEKFVTLRMGKDLEDQSGKGLVKYKFRACVIPTDKQLPPYKAWTYLVRNELAVQTGRQMFYTDDTGETIPASESDEEEAPEPVSSSLDGIRRERDEYVLCELVRHYGGLSAALMELVAEKFDAAAEVVEQRYVEITTRKATVTAADREKQGVERIVAAFCTAFCRRCRVYSCLTHAGGQVKPHKTPAPLPAPSSTDPLPPCGVHCFRVQIVTQRSKKRKPADGEAGGKRHKAEGGHQQNAAAAGDADSQKAALPPLPPQRKRKDTRDARDVREEGGASTMAGSSDTKTAGAGDGSEWTELEVSLFEKGHFLFSGNCCKIAQLVGTKNCKQVYHRVQEVGVPVLVDGGLEEKRMRHQPARKRRGPKLTRAKTAASQVVHKRLNHAQEQAWPEYRPCECTGPCGKSCSCMDNKNFCEKYCACDPMLCGIRFKGCKCESKSRCKTKTCPCFAAGHECDPDICKGCTTTCTGTAVAGSECYNMRLRLRQHKKVVMGLSEVQGWGAFLKEAAKKNDYIGEYTGELINQDEADRRGKVYDRDNNSYLFNLNEDWVIDARERGNKLRFANHSSDPNCRAEILMVDGDHRVGIFANRDIQPGEELFYDYRYEKDKAPDWAKSNQALLPGSSAQPLMKQAHNKPADKKKFTAP